MKISRLAGIGAIILLAAGCATSSHTVQAVAPAAPVAVSRLAQSDLKIVSAVYGSGRTFVDVTQRVNDLLNHRANFRARPGRMRIDPTPDAKKTLVIVYEYKGKRHTLTKGQLGKVSIQILQDAANHPV